MVGKEHETPGIIGDEKKVPDNDMWKLDVHTKSAKEKNAYLRKLAGVHGDNPMKYINLKELKYSVEYIMCLCASKSSNHQACILQ